MKLGLFIVLAIIQVLVALIPIFGKLFSEQNGSNSYKITKWGKGLVIASITSLLITILLYFFSENEEENFKKELRIEREKSDSVISSRVDFSRKILFADLSEALAKQNLQLDTVTRKLETIKDSANKVVTIIESEDPILEFCDDGIKLGGINGDTCHILVKICGKNAAGRSINLSKYVLVSEGFGEHNGFKNLEIVYYGQFLKKNSTLPNSEYLGEGIYFLHPNLNKIKSIFVVIVGTYKNSTEEKQYYLNTIGVLGLEGNKFGFLASPYDEQIVLFLKKRGLYK